MPTKRIDYKKPTTGRDYHTDRINAQGVPISERDPWQIYDSDLDYYLHEFFERRGEDLDADYKTIPNNVFKAGFRYVFNNCLRLPDDIALKTNIHSYISCDYNLLKTVSNYYIDTVLKYNIVSFIDTYIYFTRIARDTFYQWRNNPTDPHRVHVLDNPYIYTDNGNSNLYRLYKDNDKQYLDALNMLKSDVAKTITTLGAGTVRGKLSDDKTGLIVLANNDGEIGLEYEQKRTVDRIVTTARTVAELPNLFGGAIPTNDGRK